MNHNRSLVRTLFMLSLILPWSGAFATETEAPDVKMDSDLLLQFEGDVVSANIQDKPLSEVAQVLKVKAGVIIRFQTLELKQHIISVKFDKLALKKALRTILKDMNYAMITALTEQGSNIQIHVTSKLDESESVSQRELAATKSDVGEPPSEEELEIGPLSPEDLPAPPEVFDPDPAARSRELENAVALYGPESLPVVLAASSDPDAGVRDKSEQLLLNELSEAVPKETLATIAMTSESTDNRVQALEALVELEGQANYARMTLDSALRDPDTRVQQRAQALLQELSN